jgi:hypothetical protein
MSSERRRTERRKAASAKGRATLRAGRGSVETPMSSEKDVAVLQSPVGRVPLHFWDQFFLKVYQNPDKSLASDYYLIQREMAKRGKRPTATRYMLKVVAIVRRGHEFLAAETRKGLTTAIGSISADHWHNTEYRDRMTDLGIGGSSLALHAVAAAFGEAREELRVRPEEITSVRVLSDTVVHPDKRADRFTVHVFVELELNPKVRIWTLDRRRRADATESHAFNETGALTFIDAWQRFGSRTTKLLDAL